MAVADGPEAVEQSFYEAMQRGDLQALMACWADDEGISCVHPGGPRLVGLQAVQGSFANLFAHGAIDIHVHEVRRWSGEHMAVHSVIERMDVPSSDGRQSAWVFATNVYVATDAGWRLLCHHASPSRPSLARSAGGVAGTSGSPSVLH